MRNLKLIIRREYLSRVRNKTFIVMTFLSPLILVGMFFLIAYLSMLNNSEEKVIGIHDSSGIFAWEFTDTDEIRYLDFSAIPIEKAKDLVKEKSYHGVLYIPELEDNIELAGAIQFFGKESPG